MIQARRLWVQVHLWLGLTLGVIGALLGLSGCILVYDHAIDAWLHPARYATSSPEVTRPISEYAQKAEAALGNRVSAIRFPGDEAMPLIAMSRGERGMRRAFLDPASGNVLDVGSSDELIPFLHQFHETLSLRDYGGRSIVGMVGIAMLISSLTGLYLWWPASGLRRAGVGFRPGIALHRNLHYTLGFFGFVVLAMLSFTGIALAFPDAARGIVGSTPLRISVPAERGGPDEAAALALRDHAGARIAVIAFPQNGQNVYRVSLVRSVRSFGESALAWMRTLHDGSALGGVYRFVIFLGGLLPPTFVVTGLLMWLRSRHRRAPARPSLHVPAVASDD